MTARGDVLETCHDALAACAARHVASEPHLEARIYAVAHLAVSEAVSSTARDEAATQDAAAIAALQCVSGALVPSARAEVDAMAAKHLAALPDGPVKEQAMARGRSLAAAVMQRRSGDQWLEIAALRVLPDASDEAARLIAEGRDAAVSPWLKAAPFLLKSAGQIHAPVPYFTAMNGTVRTNYDLTNPRWFERVDRTLPPGVLEGTWTQRPIVAWNRIARLALEGRDLSLAERARILALLNLAMADAIISAQHSRYVLGSWRSMTMETWADARNQGPRATDISAPALFDGVERGTARLEMRPVLIPPLPNFPSLASTVAGVAERVLADCLGGDRRGFTWQVAGQEGATLQRTFGSVGEAARECAFVAALDGRHTREAVIAGHQLGHAVGREAVKRFSALRR